MKKSRTIIIDYHLSYKGKTYHKFGLNTGIKTNKKKIPELQLQLYAIRDVLGNDYKFDINDLHDAGFRFKFCDEYKTIDHFIQIDGYKCLRCSNIWVPRSKKYPKVCPKCKSAYWDTHKKK